MKLPSLSVCLFVFALFGSNSVNASFIDNGTFTTDTKSGLDWLDVTASQGLTYNYVSSQLGIGGDYEGWRYATDIEFNQMLTNYTGIEIARNDITTIYEEGLMDVLVSFFGDTANVDNPFRHTVGILIASTDPLGLYQALFIDHEETVNTPDWSITHWSITDMNNSNNFVGSYLIRYTIYSVPEPPALILVTLGLLSLIGATHIKATKLIKD